MHHRRRSMFPSAEQFIISTGRARCGNGHAWRRRGGGRPTAERRWGGVGAPACNEEAGRSFFRHGCFATGESEVRAVRAWLSSLAEELGLNPGCSLAWRSPTPCGCFACGIVSCCFSALGLAYSILSFCSRASPSRLYSVTRERASPSRLYSVTRELRSTRASSCMASMVSGCAAPNIFVRASSVRRAPAKPSFSQIRPITSPRTNIAERKAAKTASGTATKSERCTGSAGCAPRVCSCSSHARQPQG